MIFLAVLLVIVGVLLAGIEGIVPGFGLFGVSGIVCIILGSFLMADDVRSGVIYSAIIIVLLPILIPLIGKGLAKVPFLQRLIRTSELRTEDGFTVKALNSNCFLNQEGVALSPLRPSGTVVLDSGEHLDVVTRGDFIEQGERVRVIKAESTWYVVEKINV